MTKHLSEKAIETLRQFAEDGVEQIETKVRPLAPELVDRLTTSIYDDLYLRGVLTKRERHIATLSALVAMGDTQPQQRFQMMAALNFGFTRQEIEEILIQNSVFSGFSRSMNAAEILGEVYEKFRANKARQSE